MRPSATRRSCSSARWKMPMVNSARPRPSRAAPRGRWRCCGASTSTSIVPCSSTFAKRSPSGPGSRRIAPSNPGGGWDAICRNSANVFKKTGTLKSTMYVTNMPGGSGAVAIANVIAKRKGDGDLLVAAGATRAHEAKLFAGPQEENKLAALAPGLELVKDYGWFTILAKPLFWLLTQLHNILGNWGWAIVALVVLLKIAFYWLNASAYRSMAKMKAINPRIMELRERLKDKPQQMQQEMMRSSSRCTGCCCPASRCAMRRGSAGSPTWPTRKVPSWRCCRPSSRWRAPPCRSGRRPPARCRQPGGRHLAAQELLPGVGADDQVHAAGHHHQGEQERPQGRTAGGDPEGHRRRPPRPASAGRIRRCRRGERPRRPSGRPPGADRPRPDAFGVCTPHHAQHARVGVGAHGRRHRAGRCGEGPLHRGGIRRGWPRAKYRRHCARHH